MFDGGSPRASPRVHARLRRLQAPGSESSLRHGGRPESAPPRSLTLPASESEPGSLASAERRPGRLPGYAFRVPGCACTVSPGLARGRHSRGRSRRHFSPPPSGDAPPSLSLRYTETGETARLGVRVLSLHRTRAGRKPAGRRVADDSEARGRGGPGPEYRAAAAAPAAPAVTGLIEQGTPVLLARSVQPTTISRIWCLKGTRMPEGRLGCCFFHLALLRGLVLILSGPLLPQRGCGSGPSGAAGTPGSGVAAVWVFV